LKYSNQFVDWLVEEGYTHCFFVAGGNIMHLLDSVRTRMKCVPFVNEIGAAIAAEYFTVAAAELKQKAFVLVTAGPGFTNTMTAIASAWTESRELLVVGGQVKSSDLSNGEVRQRGIQEVNGIGLARPITKAVLQVRSPVSKDKIIEVISAGSSGRKGPVFIEITLDAQGADVSDSLRESQALQVFSPQAPKADLCDVRDLLSGAKRPLLLLGAGVSRTNVRTLSAEIMRIGIPIMLTWNGADLIPANFPLYMGRPNIWGQRYANILIQQADLLIAVGTRLGIQQTGFAWDEFVPGGKIVHVDIDQTELSKQHPRKALRINADADEFLGELVSETTSQPSWVEWLVFCREVRSLLPLSEAANVTKPGYVNPFSLMEEISALSGDEDTIIPCSSGSAFTVAMQAFELSGDQRMITNKGMASMGYGLSGSIGAAFANPTNNTYLFEGDGGFAQNLQELGTVKANNLRLKIFIFSNHGYASIRMTQRNYFDGAWIGCDEETGLGLPKWKELAGAFGIEYLELSANECVRMSQLSYIDELERPILVEVPIDPEQTYFPKIASRVMENGQMKSNPLHLMDPQLDVDLATRVLKYL
jgi:acetolactate synthase-1/2/3 large subunit